MKYISRPKNINKIAVLDRCVQKYWREGINKVSFNNIVKYSGVSKSTIYRLFEDEDGLQFNSMKHYYKTYIKKWHVIIETQENIYMFINDFLTQIANGTLKPCLYNKSIMEKNGLGIKGIKLLNTIEKKFTNSWYIAISKSSNMKVNDSKDLAIFIASQVSLITTLKVNQVSEKELLAIISVIRKHVLTVSKNAKTLH
jgi:hypothetical protein